MACRTKIRQFSSGYTLVEAICCLSVIAILTNINLLSYQDYSSSRVAKGLLKKISTCIWSARTLSVLTGTKTQLTITPELVTLQAQDRQALKTLCSLQVPYGYKLNFNHGSKIVCLANGRSCTAGTISISKKNQQLFALIIARSGRCRIE